MPDYTPDNPEEETEEHIETTTETSAEETPQTTEDRLLAGKYRDVAALEQGYMHSSREALRIKEERDFLREQLQRSATPEPARADTVSTALEAAEAAGMDPQVVNLVFEAARAEAREHAVQETQALLNPLLNAAQAQQGLSADDAVLFNEVLQDPGFSEQYQALASNNPEMARYVRDNAISLKRSQLEVDSRASEGSRRQAKRRAGTSGGGKTAAPTDVEAAAKQEARAKKLRDAANTGDLDSMSDFLGPIRVYGPEGLTEL